jgi:hypothetical protein
MNWLLVIGSLFIVTYISLYPIPHTLYPTYAGHFKEAGLPPASYCEGNVIVEEVEDGQHVRIEDCRSGFVCDTAKGTKVPECIQTGDVAKPSLGPGPAGLNEIDNVFDRFIRYSVGIAFVVVVFVLIIAGIKYMTSGGDPKMLQSAALTITWAGLGLVFLILAWLVLLLIESFTGVRVTVFDVKYFCEFSKVPGC